MSNDNNPNQFTVTGREFGQRILELMHMNERIRDRQIKAFLAGVAGEVGDQGLEKTVFFLELEKILTDVK